MQWLNEPLILEGKKVRLIPFDMEHYNELYKLSQNEKIWEQYPENGCDDRFLPHYFETALKYKAAGTHYPFTVVNKQTNNIIGTTRFGEIYPEYKRVEIGWTWYDTAYWGKGYNEDCKYIMLEYAFEQLKAIRVEINAAETNYRSRKAIVRIGATFEGILRNRFISPFSGKVRGVAYHGILDNEWPGIKPKLAEQRDERYAQQ